MYIFITAFISAYILGSLSAAIIICRLAGLPDPRSHGSNNPGATNVLRFAGRKYAALVLFADALKGVIAVLLAILLGVEATLIGFIAFAAILGHIFPIFFRGKGGKGVATMLGGLLAWSVWLGLAVIAIWLLVAKTTRYSSLAALIATLFAPFIALYLNPFYFIPMFLITFLIIWTHRENIRRLRSGEESKIS